MSKKRTAAASVGLALCVATSGLIAPTAASAEGPGIGEMEMTLVFDTLGWNNTASARPTITGTVDCSKAGEVYIDVSLTQRDGDGRNYGYGDAEVDCDGATRFSLIASGDVFDSGESGIEGRATYSPDDVTVERSDSIVMVPCTKIGTMGDDELRGRDGKVDRLCSLDGDDVLIGKTGNDILRGWHGNDELRGGDGNDILWGGDGDDDLYGQDGSDRLGGDAHDDYLHGGPGKDECEGGFGDNTKRSCED